MDDKSLHQSDLQRHFFYFPPYHCHSPDCCCCYVGGESATETWARDSLSLE